MKQHRAGQAASVVRTPNLILMKSIDVRFSRVCLWDEAVHAMIAQDLADDPSMCESDVPALDPDEALIEWIRSLNAEQSDVTKMPTLAENEAFYAESTVRTPELALT